MHKIKNMKLLDVISDTGWVVRSTGNCYTSWIRRIKTNRDYKEIRDILFEEGDYPGWTGVEYAPGLCEQGVLVFTSVWDSSD